MGYVDSVALAKSVFADAIEISTLETIDTAGTYLMVDSVDADNDVQDKVQLVLVVVGHSLTGDVGILPTLENYRVLIVEHRFEMTFKFIKRVEMRTPTLFSVAMGIEMLCDVY